MTNELDFTIGEVAAMLGMAPATIRAWERRYQAAEPRRSAAGRRRYTIDDITELHRVKALIASGRRSVRLAVLEAQGSAPPHPFPVRSVVPSGGSPLPWKAVVDAIPGVVLFLSSEGRILDVNRSAAETFGVSSGGLTVGPRFVDLVHSHDRGKAVKLYSPPLQERRAWEVNMRTTPPRTYSFDSRLIGGPEGVVILLMGRTVECADPEAVVPSPR
jgi:PAS domain-containing protein